MNQSFFLLRSAKIAHRIRLLNTGNDCICSKKVGKNKKRLYHMCFKSGQTNNHHELTAPLNWIVGAEIEMHENKIWGGWAYVDKAIGYTNSKSFLCWWSRFIILHHTVLDLEHAFCFSAQHKTCLTLWIFLLFQCSENCLLRKGKKTADCYHGNCKIVTVDLL